MKSRNLLLAVLLLATVTLGSVSADSRTKFDPAAFHESLRQPARLLNQIVYVPESRVHLAKRDGDQVIRGSAIDSTDGNSMDDEDNGHLLYKRDAQLIDLDAPTSARRVIRALAGCPAATTIDVQPRTIEPHTPLSVNFANLEATGIDFGQGPEYWAHWNATLLEINGDATTTLTEVNHQTITTKGAFDGCFETTRVG